MFHGIYMVFQQCHNITMVKNYIITMDPAKKTCYYNGITMVHIKKKQKKHGITMLKKKKKKMLKT